MIYNNFIPIVNHRFGPIFLRFQYRLENDDWKLNAPDNGKYPRAKCPDEYIDVRVGILKYIPQWLEK